MKTLTEPQSSLPIFLRLHTFLNQMFYANVIAQLLYSYAQEGKVKSLRDVLMKGSLIICLMFSLKWQDIGYHSPTSHTVSNTSAMT